MGESDAWQGHVNTQSTVNPTGTWGGLFIYLGNQNWNWNKSVIQAVIPSGGLLGRPHASNC